MKIFIIPIFIVAVGLLGFTVYKEGNLKHQQEANQLLNESDRPKNVSGKNVGLLIDLSTKINTGYSL